MKRIFIALMALTSVAYAASPTVSIQNFNFEYQDPRGQGSASHFSSGQLKSSQVSVELEKQGVDFKLKVSGAAEGEYVLKKAPDLLVNAKTMSAKGFNFELQNELALSLEQGEFNSPDDEVSLQKLNLNCARDLQQAEVQEQMLSGCIQRMALKSGNLSSRSFGAENLSSALIAGLTGAAASSVSINGLDLKVNAGKYEMSANVKAQVSGKARSYGNLSYDSANKVLTIKITEVKFSILNVTSQVFAELKKNENEKMKVQRPYVYLTLK